MNRLKLIHSSSIASSLTIVFITVITVVAELNIPLKGWLTSFSGHHWTSKGILSILLYVVAIFVMYVATKEIDHKKVKSGLWVAIGATVLGSIVILAFFTGHHFGWY